MTLTQSQIDKILFYLEKLFSDGCPACGGRNFELDPMIYECPVFQPKDEENYNHYPIITYRCRFCHYVMPFAACALGLVDKQGKLIE